VTADFRERPLDTVDAHVSHLVHVLRNARVSSLVYLSSTRVYRRCGTVAEEDVLLSCCPSQVEDLYDISKMLGEAVTLTCSQPARVLRLSNVYGADTSSPTFLPSIIREATETGQIVLRTAMSSSKDYVSLGDVIDMILRVAAEGARPIYNIASGQNTSHEALVRCIAEITGCRVRAIPDAPEVVEPIVSIRRLQDEFGFMPKNVIDDLPELIQSMAKTEPAP
jgi:nucleoside-diphosphate-sugar epimerase